MQPLVVTLDLDADAQDGFDAERRRLFPPGRTAVGAHVTLFHAVPGELAEQVRVDLAAQAGPAFPVQVTGVRSLGRGAAYVLDSAELSRRHRQLQQSWWSHLTAQDRQGFRPHITVQNKVAPEQARATVALLRTGFVPHQVQARGYVLWRYDDGPWTELARISFVAAPA